MIRDLLGAGRIEATADILVIGAGTVGLVLAAQLSARGKRVICLESGGREQTQETHPLNAVEQVGTPYAGAEHGRFRCLGGTSTRWGGALIPFQATDMRDAAWPITWDELAPHVPAIEALFGLPPGPYEDASLLQPGSDFVARLAKWPPFSKRNVYSLLRDRVDSEHGPEVWIHATATRYIVEAGRLAAVHAQASDGSSIAVSAQEVVIAAGAIESTRCLLLLEQQNPGSVKGKGLGQGFHDHLSAVVGELTLSDRKRLNKAVGFHFAPGGGMRNMRFELAPESSLRAQVVPCFAHIGFDEVPGGFMILREIYRALQRRALPAWGVWIELLGNSPWLVRAAWWRFINKRLLFPDGAALQLHLVIEQASRTENRISLSKRAVDAFELPLAKIDWHVAPDDVGALNKALDAFESAWQKSPLASIASLKRRTPLEISDDLAQGGGIYHPGGSTRMAQQAEQGVVDPHLRVFGIDNLLVCATSVLPTGGGTNPTMMALLLALRYASESSE